MDFRELISKAEDALNEKLAELDLSIKKAKESEVAFLDKKAALGKKDAELKLKEKELDGKIHKLANLEMVEQDLKKQAEREQSFIEREAQIKKMEEKSLDREVEAKLALQSAKDVMDKANRTKAEMESQILEKFKKMVIGE